MTRGLIMRFYSYIRNIKSRIREIRIRTLFPKNSLFPEIRYFDTLNLPELRSVNHARTYAEFAIVIQGPLSSDAGHLTETIERYIMLFPAVQIVVSTWEYSGNRSSELKLRKIQEKYPHSVHIVRSKPIENMGIANINAQICTTRAGLDFARNLGVRFVLKARTDQSLTNPRFLAILESVYLRESQKKQRAPIVVSSQNSFLFRPYSLSDMLQFSDLKTLDDFWAVALDRRESLDNLAKIPATFHEWSKCRLAEVYLISHYLESLGEILDFTLKHYHYCLTEYFAIVDADAIGHYWAKYSLRARAEKKLYFPFPRHEISSFDYFELQTKLTSYDHCEALIKDKWG